MARKYVTSKELEIDINQYLGYRFLNVYEEIQALQRGPSSISVYGLFLSDVPADKENFHGNEVHFPILFNNLSKVLRLFYDIKKHSDIKIFEEGLEKILEEPEK